MPVSSTNYKHQIPIGLNSGLLVAVIGIILLNIGAIFAIGQDISNFPRVVVVQLSVAVLSVSALLLGTRVDQRSRQKQDQGELLESNLLTNSAPVMLWMSDSDHLCTFVNQPWLDFTGRTQDEEIGNGWAENVHSDDWQSCLEGYLGAFHTRKPFQMEYRLKRADDQYRWV